MVKTLQSAALVAVLVTALAAQTAPNEGAAITIYNQAFAVVRENIALDLKTGENRTSFSGVTSRLEPDSVVLRDPSGKSHLQILEQDYRADTVSERLLLSQYEGQILDFVVTRDGKEEIVKGKVIRSGYAPANPYDNSARPADEPIVEVNGKVQFGLPGKPIFPPLSGDNILKPALTWLLHSDVAAHTDAELSYVTGGMGWSADYNVTMPEKGDTLDIMGWITLSNQSGTAFPAAHIKLLAGDVNKFAQQQGYQGYRAAGGAIGGGAGGVTEKKFDEYHLYTLPRATTLHDREIKQVEFVNAGGVQSSTLYYFSPSLAIQPQYGAPNYDPNFGTRVVNKVAVMRQFKNSEANHLGIPLPKGRLRFYRRDDDGHLEFTGEALIDHTPKDEMVKAYVGNAFDIVGERKRTDFALGERDQFGQPKYIDESFEITLRNHKTEAVDVIVPEQLYRWWNWQILHNSADFRKTDSNNIEFTLHVPANGEVELTYTVRYLR